MFVRCAAGGLLIALALVSGALFTANNFVISQLGVILASDWSNVYNTAL